MKITWGLENAAHVRGTITTLGSYDGVHLGHQKILQTLNARKRERGFSRSVVLTFHPHPQQVLKRTGTPVELLTTIEERLTLLAAQGVDETIVISFDLQFAQTSYIDFFQRTLVDQLGTEAMVVGFNHAFGKNREGDAEHLKTLAPQLGVSIEEVGPLVVRGISVSSTKIRNALAAGDVRLAHLLLGRPYGFSGSIVHGDAIGRTLGYPTANIATESCKILPGEGVYVAKATVRGQAYDAALSIGTRPTVTDSEARVVEALLLDFDQDIYNDTITVESLERIRAQQKFASLEELRDWIARDVAAVRAFADLNPASD